MKIIKNFGIGFYTGVISIIFAIISLAMFTSDYGLPYYASVASGGNIFAGVAAIILVVLYCVIPFIKISNEKIGDTVKTICIVSAVACITFVKFAFLKDRVYDFGVILGSDLELGNQKAFDAANHSIVTLVMFIITIFFIVLTSFFNSKRKLEEVTE